MAGTNVVAIKRTLIALLSESEELTSRAELGISYSPRFRDIPREYLYLGAAEFDHTYAGHKGGATRLPRDEVAYIDLHIECWAPGGIQEELDQAATEIGLVVEHLLASNFNLATNGTGLAGLTYGGVTSGKLTPVTDDDGTGALLSYRLRFTSRLN
jgi:hypothetical protein